MSNKFFKIKTEINTKILDFELFSKYRLKKSFLFSEMLIEYRNGGDYLNGRIKLVCPICTERLTEKETCFVCTNRHSFDKARQGYVNLLPVQNKHSRNPGDTKEMLTARREFLNLNEYFPICESVVGAVRKYGAKNPVLVDIGCGEGYYTAAFERECEAVCIGADISKEGVKMACSRSKNILWLVATASKLPVCDESADCVTAMFSLMLTDEYARILKKGGCVIEVTVGSQHLTELKSIIYDEVFEQHKYPSPCGEKFIEAECTEHKYNITLHNDELKNLLRMTPHFWRIHKEKREQLETVEELTLTIHYWLRVLIKK